MKRTLWIFGIVGSLFFASCDSGYDNDEVGYAENETFENRYEEDETDVAFDGDMEGTTVDQTGTAYDGVGVDGYATTGSNNNILSDTRYVCTDSTLVSDAGY